MKKLKILLAILFLLPSFFLKAQTITIAVNPSSSTGIVVGSSNYHVSESIYINTEIGNTNFTTTATAINAIAFNVSSLGNYPTTGSFLVHMKNVSSTTTSFVSGSYNTTGYTQVSSSLFSPTATGWFQINLSTPFVRIAGTNLQVLIERLDGRLYSGGIYVSSNGNNTSSALTSSRRYNGTAAPFENATILTSTSFRPSIRLMHLSPTFTATSISPTFGNICVRQSVVRTFSLNGLNLAAQNILVGPLNGYTFSTNNVTFSNQLSFLQTGTFTRTIYVRFSPTAVQSYNGSIPISGGGASSINVTAIGSGIGTTPTFTQVGPICTGNGFSLPTTSNNGILGTWSPALNNTTTTTYTFTPNGTQCATTANMTVQVNPRTTPTFTQVGSICRGGSFSLPTVSNNGITGIWSPALNNLTTTTYTFTPFSNQCANSTNMTVTINPIVTTVFTQVGPICSGNSFSLPTTSNNGITGTWSPAINNTQSTVYTFVPNAGQCANTATMNVNITPRQTPSFNQIPAICSGLNFTLPTTSNNGITGTWSPAVNNNATTTYTFTPSGTQCATTTTMTVQIIPRTTPTFTQVAPICRGGNFTLSAISNNGITGTWSPAINNTATTTYTFTPSSNFCANSITMTVVVNQPITPLFSIPSSICSGSQLVLPNTSNNGITGNWSPAINNTQTTTYTFIPTTGLCANLVSSTVTVNPLPFAQILSQRDTICEGSTVLLSAINTGNGTFTYQWFLNGVIISNATSSTYSASQAGNYTLQITNSFGCSYTTPNAKILYLTKRPTADFTYNSYCIDSPIVFSNNSIILNSLPVTYRWDFGSAGISTLYNPNPITFNVSGNYVVSLTVTPTACPLLNNRKSKTIVIDTFVPNIRYETINAISNVTSDLSARTFANASYLWTPNTNFINNNNSRVVQFNGTTPMEFIINITQLSGCKIKDTLKVNMFNRAEIFVPQAFSPNRDGNNDKLDVITVGIERLNYFIVFNRWGQKIYTSKSLFDSGWDGTCNGIVQPMERYTWIAEGVGANGIIIKEKGSTILIR
jgi:gliding motility-associated-like protein